MTSEQLLERCIALAGGHRMSDVLADAASGANADFFFEEENIIAEAKALEKDYATDPTIAGKMQALLDGWMAEGKFFFYGNVLPLHELPVECAAELVQLFRTPLGDRLKKANQQIKTCKKRLNRPDALGLLILSNDGNFTLYPEMTFFLLNHLLRGKLSSIEHVIYVAPFLRTNLAGLRPQVAPFFSISFSDRRQPSPAFVQGLYAAWLSTLREFSGEVIEDMGWQRLDSTTIEQSRFRPATEPGT